MTTTRAAIVLHHIRSLAAEPTSGADDRSLLERFTAERDQAAFAELVQRHGSMVLGVCRRLLADAHAADDAFQATFLVLARKAASISRAESVGGWLHRVAYNTALKAKAGAAARTHRERRAAARSPSGPLDELTGRELLAALDEELARLPQRCRAPLVLCYLEGKTRDEAAQQLRCPLGTLKHRLEEGRAHLRARLERRGLGLPGALLAACAGTTAVSPALLACTAEAVRLVVSGRVAGLSAQVAGLMEGTAPSARQLKTAAAVLLAVSLVAVGLLLSGEPASELSEPPAKEAGNPATAAKDVGRDRSAEKTPASDAKSLRVAGRVLDPEGKPVAAAEVAARVFRSPNASLDAPEITARGKTDVGGEYRLDVAVGPDESYRIAVRAAARGHGLGGILIDSRDPKPDWTIKLVAEHVFRGRLVSLEGAAAAGVKLRVRYEAGIPEGDPWPGPITSDERGRFTVRGLGAGMRAALEVDDERFARQFLPLETGAGKLPEEQTFTLAPLRILEGIVTAEDTGKPIPGARIVVGVLGFQGVEARTDERGRYRLIPFREVYSPLFVFPPDGVPYVPWRVDEISWPRAAVKRTVDVKLPRGVLLRGKVIEAGSGKPVAGARVGFRPRRRDNPAYRREGVHFSGLSFRGWVGLSAQMNEQKTGADGTFQLAVLPGPGHLAVKGEPPDFIAVATSYHEMESGKPGGQRYYPDAIVALDPRSEKTPAEVVVELRRGVTVTAHLVGSDGKPAGQGAAVRPGFASPGSWLHFLPNPFPPGDTVIALPGCDPEKLTPVVILDLEGSLGGVAEVSAKQAKDGPITIRLGRCGSATLRFIDDKGKPWANHPVGFDPLYAQLFVLVTPGTIAGGAVVDEKELQSDFVWLSSDLARARYESLRTDAEGRVTFPVLIPGATLALMTGPPTGRIKKEFTVKAGENVKLPDVVIERPAE